ncbi:hypothetical protein [Thermococcus stetteri]|uniref:hypothetical protein n=1 Tax=Thermococcus stetteri TaxID=49900 RepID=UPI001AEA9D21|nr:hypothetical protein [Thermococcus stetteri]MBP1910867.1 hypothetical protein [Thermococcus stetteri]
MQREIVWLLVGIVLGNLLLVYASNPATKCGSGVIPALWAKVSSNYSIQGPFNWTPRPISKKLPAEVLKLAKSKYPTLRDATYIVTLINKDANYSILAAGSDFFFFNKPRPSVRGTVLGRLTLDKESNLF